MSAQTIIVSAVVGVVASVITGYITTHLKMREDRAAWRREFLVKYASTGAMDLAAAQRLAAQVVREKILLMNFIVLHCAKDLVSG
jgi:hypothetical protein